MEPGWQALLDFRGWGGGGQAGRTLETAIDRPSNPGPQPPLPPCGPFTLCLESHLYQTLGLRCLEKQVPVMKMRELRVTDMKHLAQDYRASKSRVKGLN